MGRPVGRIIPDGASLPGRPWSCSSATRNRSASCLGMRPASSVPTPPCVPVRLPSRRGDVVRVAVVAPGWQLEPGWEDAPQVGRLGAVEPEPAIPDRPPWDARQQVEAAQSADDWSAIDNDGYEGEHVLFTPKDPELTDGRLRKGSDMEGWIDVGSRRGSSASRSCTPTASSVRSTSGWPDPEHPAGLTVWRSAPRGRSHGWHRTTAQHPGRPPAGAPTPTGVPRLQPGPAAQRAASRARRSRCQRGAATRPGEEDRPAEVVVPPVASVVEAGHGDDETDDAPRASARQHHREPPAPGSTATAAMTATARSQMGHTSIIAAMPRSARCHRRSN